MNSEIIIREARPEDYPSFRKMEEEAWKDSGIEVLSEELYLTWIKVFSAGFILAIFDNEVVGHVYCQVCDYDPFDTKDERNLYQITDNLFTVKTHNINGNCIYPFSITSIRAGAANLINEYLINLSIKLKKEYYAGAVRMTGLSRYAKKMEQHELTREFVHEYATLVENTIKKKHLSSKKVFDPIVSPILKNPNLKYARVISDFFPYSNGAESWGCVMYFQNNSMR
jgi:hypothetical protein